MILYIVVFFGLIAIFQLHGIGRHLSDSLNAVRDMKKEIQDIREKTAEELRWYKDSTFAHELREWLREIPMGVVEELQWHKDSTFARDLREWLQEVSKEVAGEIQTASTDIAGEIRTSVVDILTALEKIEENTSKS